MTVRSKGVNGGELCWQKEKNLEPDFLKKNICFGNGYVISLIAKKKKEGMKNRKNITLDKEALNGWGEK